MRERESSQLNFADTVVSQLGGRRTAAFLEAIDAAVEWESMARPVRKLYRNDEGGAPAQPPVMMVKILMLQKWFGLSDPQMEEQLNDRVSFRRFVGLRGSEPAVDETTIVKFRRRLREAGLEEELVRIVARSMAAKGLLVKEGTVVDAMILEAPRGRKVADEKAPDAPPRSTRDAEASYTKKHGRVYHGYKGHIAIDRSGIVTAHAFSTASHHDSRYIDRLIEKERRIVLADSAYADAARRERLARRGVSDGIMFKRTRGGGPLSPLLLRINRMIATFRSGVEHTIARLRKWGMARARYRGERRNAFDFTLGVIAHNLRRAAWLASG